MIAFLRRWLNGRVHVRIEPWNDIRTTAQKEAYRAAAQDAHDRELQRRYDELVAANAAFRALRSREWA